MNKEKQAAKDRTKEARKTEDEKEGGKAVQVNTWEGRKDRYRIMRAWVEK